jgi:hypothetical protein
MADEPASFYDPKASAGASAPEKRKPGRPAKAAPKEEIAAAIAQPAHPVTEALSVDHELAPDATPRPDESLEDAIARVGAIRERNRKEWGEFSQKLALPKRNGYHTHWFNDVAGRIDEALASGWSHRINPRDGRPFHRVVGSGRDGKPLEAYAMDLPLVFWQEEMDARHKLASDRIEAIKKAPFQAKPGQAQASDKGKFYDPTEGQAGPLQVVKG